MKQKGFTLIELLAVIVLLAVIALIATPLTINVINNAKEKSFVNTAYGLMDGAKLLSTEQQFNEETGEVLVQFTDGVADNENFKVSGDMPTSGTIHLTKEGKVELKVWSEDLGKCAEKTINESEVKITDTTKEECKLDITVVTARTFTEVMSASSEVAALDPDGNLRYVGADPDNYVEFNGELWRIIGVFDIATTEGGTTEKRAKIIKQEPIGSYSWDSSAYEVNDGQGINEWRQADLQVTLNSTYLTGGTGTCYGESSNSAKECIFGTNEGEIKPLSTEAQSLIDDAVWNTGTVSSDKTYSASTLDFYNGERSSNTGKVSCSSESTLCNDDVERKTLWTGKVGLMYPSDYGYSMAGTETTDSATCQSSSMSALGESDCGATSWLVDSYYKWTLTPVAETNVGYAVYWLLTDGMINTDRAAQERSVNPVVYLSADVVITDGLGTDQQPFIISKQ